MKRFVYIDTSEFVAANFAFAGPRFRTILSRVEAGQIEIGLTAITKREIISQMDKALHEADQAIAKARSAVRVLRNLDDDLSKSIFHEFPRATYKQQLIAQLDAFLSAAKVVNLDFDGVDPATVFDLYFEKKPPFGDGKKKSEFPDAFSLSMIATWAEDNQEDVLIASSDSDVQSGVDSFMRLQYVGTLEQLLNRIALEFDQLAPAAETIFQSLEQNVVGRLRTQFQELGFVLMDQDGDILSVQATDVSYDASLLRVDDVGEGCGEALFDLYGTVQFEADLSYGDMATASYDHEDKRYYVHNTIRETVRRDEHFQASVTVTFSLTDSGILDFEVSWESPKEVAVSSSVMDEWPYK